MERNSGFGARVEPVGTPAQIVSGAEARKVAPKRKARGDAMRTIHRITAILSVAIMLYIGVTGTWMQVLDLRALYANAGPLDPTMRSIREGLGGEPNYAVKRTEDFFAPALPAGLDYAKAMDTTLAGYHRQYPAGEVRYAELASREGEIVGRVHDAGGASHVYAVSDGAPLGSTVREEPDHPPPNLRETIKQWHRMWVLGPNVGTFVDLACGLVLWALIVTGLVFYWRLYKMRRKIRKPQPFWSAGGQMRTWHRAIAVAASVFIVMMAGSGTLIAFESAFASFHFLRPGPVPGMSVAEWGMKGDMSKPLDDAEVAGMTGATLTAFAKDQPGVAIRRLRVRQFARMAQGVVITDGAEPRQLVYNLTTGAPASLSEPEYPFSGFPFGVQMHEDIKRFHRGDLLGMPGRWMNLLSGFALIFLSVSGIVMYLDMWRKRRAGGRRAFIWKG